MSDRRYEQIDALRGVAALMVIALHATELFRKSFPEVPVSSLLSDIIIKFDFGRAGVVLFFAISGFVLPSSLRGKDPWQVFPVRRFLRLYPAYWVSLLTGLIALHWIWGKTPDLADVAANATMLQRFFEVEDIVGVYWTLQVELVFYGICFGLGALGLLNNGWVLSGVALAAALWWYVILATGLGLFQPLLAARPPFDGYYLEFVAYFSIMFLGASCRRFQSGATEGWPLTCLAIILWLIVQPMTGLFLYSRGTAPEFVALKYGGYAIGLWVFFVFGFVVPIRSPLSTWLGRISYSLYLQHLPVIYGLHWLAVTFGWAGHIGVWGWLTLSLVLTIGVAVVSYKVTEAPSIALSDRLTRKLRQSRPRINAGAGHEAS